MKKEEYLKKMDTLNIKYKEKKISQKEYCETIINIVTKIFGDKEINLLFSERVTLNSILAFTKQALFVQNIALKVQKIIK